MALSSLNERISEAVGDSEYGYLSGTVINNVDPLGIGRIKVRVPELMDNSLGELPWVGPHKSSPFGQGQGYGVYGSPAIGSKVRIRLQNNDLNYGLHEADNYETVDANPKFKDPNTWGFKDPVGNELFVNMSTGDWQFTTKAGTKVFHDGAGNLVVNVVNNETSTVGGNATRTVTGNSTTTVNGSQTDTIKGGLTITVTGDATISATGNATLSAGGSIAVTAGGSVDITGSTVNLN